MLIFDRQNGCQGDFVNIEYPGYSDLGVIHWDNKINSMNCQSHSQLSQADAKNMDNDAHVDEEQDDKVARAVVPAVAHANMPMVHQNQKRGPGVSVSARSERLTFANASRSICAPTSTGKSARTTV